MFLIGCRKSTAESVDFYLTEYNGGAYLRGGEHYERIDGIGDEPKGDEE